MSPASRCDLILKLIGDVLDGPAPSCQASVWKRLPAPCGCPEGGSRTSDTERTDR
jgi:hypothetical protein